MMTPTEVVVLRLLHRIGKATCILLLNDDDQRPEAVAVQRRHRSEASRKLRTDLDHVCELLESEGHTLNDPGDESAGRRTAPDWR